MWITNMYAIIDIYLLTSQTNSFEPYFTTMIKYFVFLIKILYFLPINGLPGWKDFMSLVHFGVLVDVI